MSYSVKDFLKVMSFPRLYLQLGKSSMRAVVTYFLVAILFLQGYENKDIYNIYAIGSFIVAGVMFLSWQGFFSRRFYLSLMLLCLFSVFISCLFLVHVGYGSDWVIWVAMFVIFSTTLLNNLSGALARSAVQERGEDAGMALFQVLLPVSVSLMLFVTGFLGDVHYDYVFMFTAFCALFLIYFQYKYRVGDVLLPKKVKPSSKAAKVLLLDLAMNISFIPVSRIILPVFVVMYAVEIGLEGHAMKILGMVTSILMLFGLLYQSLKSNFGKWRLNGKMVLYWGMMLYAVCILLWGIIVQFMPNNLVSLGLIFSLWMIMQLASPMWNVGYFSELKASIPDYMENKEEIYRSYNQIFGVFLNLGGGLGMLMAFALAHYFSGELAPLLIFFGLWAVLCGFVYMRSNHY